MLRDMESETRESELKEIKQNVVRCLESIIEELKSTLVTIFTK